MLVHAQSGGSTRFADGINEKKNEVNLQVRLVDCGTLARNDQTVKSSLSLSRDDLMVVSI